MSCTFAKEALKICVAQICQNIGWHAVQSSPMEILVDVIHRYLLELSKSIHGYSTQYNRTVPNLDDLGLAFKDFGVNLPEIEEYVNNVEPVPFVQKIAAFPVKHLSNLQHPKPSSRELLHRPDHIPEYLPLMHPELEEEEGHFSSHSSGDGIKKNAGDANNIGGDSPSPISSPRHGSKRSSDWPPGDTPNKKPRYYSEEEGRPMREVTSVFMSPAGFISPVHEGKVAESSLPCLVDSPPSSPDPPPQSFSTSVSKKDSKSKDVKREKSSKSKRDKESSKKDSKKLKTSKKEKENKENALRKSEKASNSSLSVKKEHSSSHKSSGKSDKSGKSDESFRSKSKGEKSKFKVRKGDLHKIKDSFKLSKSKSKLKHTMMSSSSRMKSPKISSSKRFKSVKSPKIRSPRRAEISKPTSSESTPIAFNDVALKEEVEDKKLFSIAGNLKEKKPEIEKEEPFIMDELDDDDFREESPEPERLVIDDSLETQARQEKESRLAVLDRCIEAVIRRAEEESEVEVEKTNKAMDDIINSVIRGPPGGRKLEPKDIYDFTDTSDSSLLSSDDMMSHAPESSPSKKEKKSGESPKSKKSNSPKKKNKDKQKKRSSKDSKSRSPTGYTSPKSQKYMLKVEDRTPSPGSIQDELFSSDESSLCPSPASNNLFDTLPKESSHMLTPTPFVPSPAMSGFSSSPFAPIRPLPCHIQANPHFPTPPLFVTPGKSADTATSFLNNVQPLNLAKSSTPKVSPESKTFESSLMSPQSSRLEDLKKATNVEKLKLKDHKKEKIDKKEKPKKKGKDKKEIEKVKERKEDLKEKVKVKEISKAKPEKAVKADKRKVKTEKKKGRAQEIKDDSTVPKMTLKLSSGNSAKIFIKPSSKNSSAGPSSPIPSEPEDLAPTPSPPPHVPTPSPPRIDTPPPRELTPSPPPPLAVAVPSPSAPDPDPEPEEEISPPPPVAKAAPSRGRGRGRKAAATAAAAIVVQPILPPARTVITETLGTIVDESGNKIWICPACSRADDGSPMIGCDGCDDWYHWICVGIVVPPKEEENWFCSRCVSKRQGSNNKRRRKKHRKDK